MAEDPPPPYSAAVGSQSAPCSVITIPQIPIPAVIQENPPHYSAAVSIREDPQLRINPASLRDDPPLYSKCAAMWENPRGQNNSGTLPENPTLRVSSVPVRWNPSGRSNHVASRSLVDETANVPYSLLDANERWRICAIFTTAITIIVAITICILQFGLKGS